MLHLQGNVELFQVFQAEKQKSKTLGRLVFWHMLSGFQHREGAPGGGLNQGGAGGGDGGERLHLENILKKWQILVIDGKLFFNYLVLQWPISDATDSGRPSINPSPGKVVAMGQALCKGLKDQIESLPGTYPSPPPSHPSTRLCTPETHRASQICTMGLIKTVSERHLITALRLGKEVITPG